MPRLPACRCGDPKFERDFSSPQGSLRPLPLYLQRRGSLLSPNLHERRRLDEAGGGSNDPGEGGGGEPALPSSILELPGLQGLQGAIQLLEDKGFFDTLSNP